MFKTTLLTILLFSCFEFLKSECDLSLFQEKNMVPNILPATPKQPITVQLLDDTISCGQTLSPATTLLSDRPEMTYNADENTYYTLIMIDPDVPSPDAPLLGPGLHWLVINIPGDDVKSGDEQKPYLPPLPPPGSGPHRYISMIMKQKKKLKNIKCFTSSLESRTNFDLMGTMKKLGLSEISFGHYFNVTSSNPDAMSSDALKKTKKLAK